MKLTPKIMKIMKIETLLKSGVFAVVFIIANLLLVRNTFGQAGPVRLKGSGGATVTEINISGTWYEIHTYSATGSSTFTPPSGVSSVEYLVVAGGAGGGGVTNGNVFGSGGGGAGGFLTNVGGGGLSVSVQSYPVSVGIGGSAGIGGTSQGGSGVASFFTTVSATGGGGGGSTGFNNGLAGGSGGGGRSTGIGGSGIAGQGNNGANNSGNNAGAGGGGAGSAGTAGGIASGGSGGSGSTNSITGSAVTYAAGGNGGDYGTPVAGTSGTPNTGNGGRGAGGGTAGSAFNGGTGGSGIVIIRYKAPTMAITTQPSVTVANGSNFTQPVVIQILDGNGIAVSGVVVTVAIQSGTGGTLSNNTATTDASGNATFTNLQLSGPAVNAYTLNFKVPGSGNVVVSNAINICSNPTSTVTAQKNISCNGASDGTITVQASGGTSPYTFSINNGTYIAGSGADINTFTGLAPNTPYQIKVKDSNGCISK